MIDPVSAFYGLKYGYKGTKALWEWLDTPNSKGAVEDIAEMKRIVKALVEDNQRLIALTQEHEKKLASLELKAIGAILLVILVNALVCWAIFSCFHH